MKASTSVRWLFVTSSLLVLALFLSTPATAFPDRWEYDRTWPAPGRGDFVLADLNGDGIEELAAVDDDVLGVRVYDGTVAGIPRDSTALLSTGIVADLAAADVDGDKRLDLVSVGAYEGTWFRWDAENPKNPPERETFELDREALAVAPGDFDSDGDTDLAMLNSVGSRVWFQVNGSFSSNASVVLAEDESFRAIVAGDIDGDGRQDLILARPFEIRVYRQGEVGFDLEPVHVSTPTSGDLSLGLLDAPDRMGGIPYVAAVGLWDPSQAGGLGLWQWENATLQLKFATRSPDAKWIAVGDVNDDRRPDVLVCRADGDTHIFLQGDGTMVSTIPDLVLTGLGPGALGPAAVGDVNGDGFEDIVLRGANPNRFVAYLQEDAPPTLARPIPSTYAVNRGAHVRGVVDLREFFVDDHGVLTFEIVSESDEDLLVATVEGSLLDFDASADAYGAAEFRVAAWDGNPSHSPVESNAFSVVVNDVPLVVSAPPLRATVGEPYAYVIRVSDAYPAVERHAYALLARPDGMAIDPATGLITWTPEEGQAGAQSVRVEIRDNHGGWILHMFTVVVAPIGPGSPVTVMAVGIVGTSVALAAAAALLNENAKWAFLLFFLPLYSKIKRERVLDHFVRGQIFGYIQANPGEHYNAIKDALGLTNGSLAHHLRTLEREQFVKSRRFGLYRRFYPMHYRIPDQDAFQPNEIQTTIMDVIRQSPGITQKEIATRLGVTAPTVNYHVTVLSARNLIHVVRRGRSTHCSIVDMPT